MNEKSNVFTIHYDKLTVTKIDICSDQMLETTERQLCTYESHEILTHLHIICMQRKKWLHNRIHAVIQRVSQATNECRILALVAHMTVNCFIPPPSTMSSSTPPPSTPTPPPPPSSQFCILRYICTHQWMAYILAWKMCCV